MPHCCGSVLFRLRIERRTVVRRRKVVPPRDRLGSSRIRFIPPSFEVRDSMWCMVWGFERILVSRALFSIAPPLFICCRGIGCCGRPEQKIDKIGHSFLSFCECVIVRIVKNVCLCVWEKNIQPRNWKRKANREGGGGREEKEQEIAKHSETDKERDGALSCKRSDISLHCSISSTVQHKRKPQLTKTQKPLESFQARGLFFTFRKLKSFLNDVTTTSVLRVKGDRTKDLHPWSALRGCLWLHSQSRKVCPLHLAPSQKWLRARSLTEHVVCELASLLWLLEYIRTCTLATIIAVFLCFLKFYGFHKFAVLTEDQDMGFRVSERRKHYFSSHKNWLC